jgi:hypothetical protein
MRKTKLKKKIIKKVNPANFTIVLVCILAGYIIVALPYAASRRSTEGPIEEITHSVKSIANSFEVYNQKKFGNSSFPNEPAGL